MTGRWQANWSRCGAALLFAHVVVGVVRVPGVVWQRRCDDIDAYRRHGAPAFFLEQQGRRGAAALEWLRAHTADDTVVLWRGDSDGAFEFAPALLAPRWCVQEPFARAPARDYRGRPLAARGDEAGTRVVVLHGSARELRLEER